MILYSKPFVDKIEKEILRKARRMKTPPVLGIVLAGNNPASLSYIKRKELAAKKLGCEAKLFHFPTSADENEIIALIKKISANKAPTSKLVGIKRNSSEAEYPPALASGELRKGYSPLAPSSDQQVGRYSAKENKKISGIIVQLPLPAKFNTEKIISAIKKEKDVDNLRGDSPFISPAVQAIWQLLNAKNKPSKKANVLIVGYGHTIGQPMHSYLSKKGFANITIADKNTKNLVRLTEKSDVIISGAGKIAGDVDIKSVEKTAKFVTPVPGGVGPLTVSYLFKNLVLANYKLQN